MEKVGGNLSFQEEYLFWKLVQYFIIEKEYRIIQLAKSQKEIWLEKLENKETPVIRILLHQLDWSNWLQRDIHLTLANGESIRKQLKKRKINVTNIYITPYPPVDDYEFLIEKPILHPKGEKTIVKSIICDRQHRVRGIETYRNEFIHFDLDWQDEYGEREVEEAKQLALSSARKKAKTEHAIFENGKPFFTYIFIALQVIIYLLMEAAGGSTNTSVLIEFGAKVNWLIMEGEWWRLFAPIIIHIGLLHLAMNTLALYYLGMTVERIYGNIRFLFIYIFAGFIGSLASLLFSPNISAGASGAIFGCFGALLYFGVINPRLFFRTMGYNILFVIAINLLFGFSVTGIDNAGHIGGLIGGFIAAAITHIPKKIKLSIQIPALVISATLVYFVIQYSFQTPGRLMDEQSAIVLAQEYAKSEDFDSAYRILEEFLDYNEDTVNVLFLLSFTEIKTGRVEDAKAHLLQVIEQKPNFHEALYNLALVYFSEENYEQAKEYASKALEYKPTNSDYQQLIEQITDSEAAVLES